MKFKVGDKVEHKLLPTLGVGEVVRVDFNDDVFPLKVRWPASRNMLRSPGVYYPLKDIKLAETPIQRMKRLYSEKKE